MGSRGARPGTGNRTARSTRRRSWDGNIQTFSPTRKKGSGTKIATGLDAGIVVRAGMARRRQRQRAAPSAQTRNVAKRWTSGCAAACCLARMLHTLRHPLHRNSHLLRRHLLHRRLRLHRAPMDGGSWVVASTDPRPTTFRDLLFPCRKMGCEWPSDLP